MLVKCKMAAKVATIVGDVTGLPQCHYPYNIPRLVKKIKRFPLKVKSFQNTATYRKLREGVPSTPPPPCTTVGVWICLSRLKTHSKVAMASERLFGLALFFALPSYHPLRSFSALRTSPVQPRWAHKAPVIKATLINIRYSRLLPLVQQSAFLHGSIQGATFLLICQLSEQSITRPQSLKYVIYSTTTDWRTLNHLYRKSDLQPLSEILGTFGTDIIRNLWPESRNRRMRTCTLTQCLSQQYHLRNPVCQIAGYAPGPGYKHWPSLIALIPNWFSKWEDT